MARFRKKPVEIEAVQWTGSNADEVFGFCNGKISWGAIIGTLDIRTLEGIMTANENDWIIKGIHGEFYPCKPDIFEKTYEPV